MPARIVASTLFVRQATKTARPPANRRWLPMLRSNVPAGAMSSGRTIAVKTAGGTNRSARRIDLRHRDARQKVDEGQPHGVGEQPANQDDQPDVHFAGSRIIPTPMPASAANISPDW